MYGRIFVATAVHICIFLLAICTHILSSRGNSCYVILSFSHLMTIDNIEGSRARYCFLTFLLIFLLIVIIVFLSVLYCIMSSSVAYCMTRLCNQLKFHHWQTTAAWELFLTPLFSNPNPIICWLGLLRWREQWCIRMTQFQVSYLIIKMIQMIHLIFKSFFIHRRSTG